MIVPEGQAGGDLLAIGTEVSVDAVAADRGLRSGCRGGPRG